MEKKKFVRPIKHDPSSMKKDEWCNEPYDFNSFFYKFRNIHLKLEMEES